MAQSARQAGDFGSLRDAFITLASIYSMNGSVLVDKKGISLSNIPRQKWSETLNRVRSNEAMLKSLVMGSGQRASVQGRREVVLAVIGSAGTMEVAALLVTGRGVIEKAICVTSKNVDWKERLAGFVNWDEIEGIIPAAEGNNQRAMIGLVLQLAGIGRGKLDIVEAEVPEEVDEAAQSVRGADWLKAGLPRFESAAAEALWYLMRIRSVHARMVRLRKQGYYTSMALGAMYASGMSISEMADATGLPSSLAEKLTPKPGDEIAIPAGVDGLGGAFDKLELGGDERRSYCVNKVWKGAAIYARVLDRRIRLGAIARARIGTGDDIVTIAQELKIARRDLIRVLSVRQEDAVMERERFVGAIIDPDLVRKASMSETKDRQT